MDSQSREIIETLELMMRDFSVEQKEKAEKAMKNIPNLLRINPTQAAKFLNEIGVSFLDLEFYRKKLRESKQKPKKEKISPNDPCPCNSGKKYKKCCFRNE